MSELTALFEATRNASLAIPALDDAARNGLLLTLADRLVEQAGPLLEANAVDLAAMSQDNPLYDRLMLTKERLEGIA